MQVTNPQVDPALQLLAEGYEHDGMYFDLYGENTKFCIEVLDVTLFGDNRSLGALFSAKAMEDMGYALERQAERDARDERLDRAVHAFSVAA